MRIKGQVIVKFFYRPPAENRVSCWLLKAVGRAAGRPLRRRRRRPWNRD